MKILGINGSPRKRGNTASIITSMLAGAESAGAEVEHIHLPAYHIQGCIGCERCRRDKTCTQFYDGMHLLYDRIDTAEGLILGSPTYNYNLTPWMKAFIDRLYPFFEFTEPRPGPYSSRLSDRGKQALVFGVCEQHDPREAGYTVVSMRDAIAALGYEIFDEQTFASHFYSDSAAKHEGDMQKAFVSGEKFAMSLN